MNNNEAKKMKENKNILFKENLKPKFKNNKTVLRCPLQDITNLIKNKEPSKLNNQNHSIFQNKNNLTVLETIYSNKKNESNSTRKFIR